MESQLDIVLIGGALVALSCVLIFLGARPGKKRRAEVLTLTSMPFDGASEAAVPGPRVVAPDHSVFVSYRRSDSLDIVGRLSEHLKKAFGENAIFKDLDSMELGPDFRSQLEASLNACRVLICVMGDQWAGPGEPPNRRIDNPEDYVRIEVETALRRNITVIPVLVKGVRARPRDFFPPSLSELAYRQGLSLRPDPDFLNDVKKLIEGIEKKIIPTPEGSQGV